MPGVRRKIEQDFQLEVVYSRVPPEEDAAVRRAAMRYLLDCFHRRERPEEVPVSQRADGCREGS